MAITLEQAKGLKVGQTLYHVTNRNADGTAQRWRVNGVPKVWKRHPEWVRVPVKCGLWACDCVSHGELHLVSLTDPTVKDKAA